MLIKKFLDGSGFLDSNLAISVLLDDFHTLLENDNWNTLIKTNYHIESIDDSIKIVNGNREVILINEREKKLLESLLEENLGQNKLIFLFRPKKKISEEIKNVLTQNKISLLDLPIPKPENEYAKSIIRTSKFEKYLANIHNTPMPQFWYDLVIGIISNFIVSYISYIRR